MLRGICGIHSGSRSMETCVLKARYYWLMMRKDCIQFVEKGKECQKFKNIFHLPAEELHNIVAPWPFAIWGIDILRPFPLAKGHVKYLLVGINHFTMWIEAEPIATILATNVRKFIWKNIVCQFGIPNTLISPNKTYFMDKGVEKFLESLGIKHRATSLEHPYSNGQTEATNKVIIWELKKWVRKAKGNWAEELPVILWAYRCSL